jgi:hypothetical protein
MEVINNSLEETKSTIKHTIAPEVIENFKRWSDDRISIFKDLSQIVYNLQRTLPINADKTPLEYIDPQIVQEYLCHNNYSNPDTSSYSIDPNNTASLSGDESFLAYSNPEAVPIVPDHNNHLVQMAGKAAVKLDYSDGFAVVEKTNLPFWERLDGELIDCYKLFENYRDQKELIGTRSYTRVATLTGLQGPVVVAIARVYHWQARARCYDLYRELEIATRKANLIHQMETTHQKTARKLFDKVTGYLLNELNKKNPMITPKVAVDLLNSAVALERTSLGLDAKGSKNSEGSSHTNIIQIGNQKASNTLNPAPQTSNYDQSKLQEILDVLSVAGVIGNKEEVTQEEDSSQIEITEEVRRAIHIGKIKIPTKYPVIDQPSQSSSMIETKPLELLDIGGCENNKLSNTITNSRW